MPRYVQPDELAVWLTKEPETVRVVDVRGDDRVGGWIGGSVNVPRDAFPGRVQQLVADMRGVKRVVFHCMLSQVRGPFCAAMFEEASKRALPADGDRPETVVLQGGFQGWVSWWRQSRDSNPHFHRLTEGFDESYW